MKILFVENNDITLNSFRKELLDDLIRQKHQLCLVGEFKNKTLNKYASKTTLYNIKTNLKSKSIFANYFLKKKYEQIIKDFGPDILLTFTIKPNIYCNLKKHDCISIANITGLGTSFNKNNFLQKIIVRLYKKSFKNVDYVFCQNESIISVLKSHNIPVKNSVLIPGSGVNIEKYRLSPLDEHNNIEFLFPSRLIKEKGFFVLLDAIPEVLKKYPNCHFTFYGSSNKESDEFVKKNKLNDSPNYEFHSFSDDMNEIYKKCDFVVSPSFYNEGMSNVLLEALATGRPIITTNDNPGCKEILQENVNGFGVKSNNVDDLVKALCHAASLDKIKIEEMGKNGRKFVEDNFDRKIVINIYNQTIEKYSK